MSEMIEANAPDDENSGATQGFDDSLAQGNYTIVLYTLYCMR